MAEERIDRILEKIRKHWKEHPELRFCQIIGNALGKGDHYYVEDNEFEEKFEEMLLKKYDQ